MTGYLTIRQLALRWRRNPATIWRWIAAGKIRARPRGPLSERPLVIALADIEAAEAMVEEESAAAAAAAEEAKKNNEI